MAIKWEYCELRLIYFSADFSKPEADEQIIQALVVKYHSPEGKTDLQVLREIRGKQIRQQDLESSDFFGMALGNLGGGGWELVTLYKEEDRRDFATSFNGYFKRQVVEGRPTNEPKLEL